MMLLTALGEPISRIVTGSRSSGGGGSATGTVAVAVSVAGGLARKFLYISIIRLFTGWIADNRQQHYLTAV